MTQQYAFGSTSVSRIETCHKDLQLILYVAISRSKVDFGIAEGHRPVKRQQELYASGRTKPGPILTSLDGVSKKGKHNEFPSDAADIYAWVNGQSSYEDRHLCYVAGVIESVAQELYEAGKVSHLIRWGGNWDQDGEIITDQRLKDLPHYELYKP